MNRKWLLYALICAMPLAGGCQCVQQFTREVKSQTSGLHREIRLFDYQGHLLGQWESRTVIDNDEAGHAAFFDSTGRRVTTMGGILISTEDAN